MTYPNIVWASDIIAHGNDNAVKLADGRYVPARALGFQSLRYRLRATWLVFTGRADALLWEGQQ